MYNIILYLLPIFLLICITIYRCTTNPKSISHSEIKYHLINDIRV